MRVPLLLTGRPWCNGVFAGVYHLLWANMAELWFHSLLLKWTGYEMFVLSEWKPPILAHILNHSAEDRLCRCVCVCLCCLCSRFSESNEPSDYFSFSCSKWNDNRCHADRWRSVWLVIFMLLLCCVLREISRLFSSQQGQMFDPNIVVNALSMRHTKQASSNKQTSAFHFITLSLWIVIMEIQPLNNCQKLN